MSSIANELDPRTTARGLPGWETRVRFGKTGEANVRSTSTPSVCSQCVCVELESAWICDEEE